jgi:hyperosmotically inducible protein
MRFRLLSPAALALALIVPSLASAQMSDQVLGARVADSVQRYSNFTIFDDVNIEISNRVVTLTGRVTAPKKKEDIGTRVAKIDGIRTLVNDIQVLPVSQMDSNLRLRVAQAIYGHPSFWHYASMANPPIHIVVENGRITLTGWVNSEVERSLAFALAQVSGSFGVKNELKIDRR